MRNFKVILQYEGTRYNGWQRQGNTPDTIQERLERVLTKLAGRPVEVHGSGRTDAGTHAAGQTANFHLDTALPPKEVMAYLNAYLPQDIGVIEIEEVPLRFHSRLNAKRKTYQYRIHRGSVPMVFDRRYMAEYPGPLEVQAMRQAAAYLLGRHDFKAFCANRHMKKSTVRTLYDIEIIELPGELRFVVCGSGFLQHMVRILVGTLCEVGAGKRSPDGMTALLDGRGRSEAGETMPAQGLMLMKVEYGTAEQRGLDQEMAGTAE